MENNLEANKNQEIDESTSENAPEKVEKQSEDAPEVEILKDVPNDIKKVIQMGMSMQRITGPMPNPIAEKITASHIDKILDLTGKDGEHEFQDSQSSRKYALVYFLIAIAVFIFLVVFLVSHDKELLKEILKIFITFLGGFGAGYGVKAYRDSKG
jgi:hypothetical protein